MAFRYKTLIAVVPMLAAGIVRAGSDREMNPGAGCRNIPTGFSS